MAGLTAYATPDQLIALFGGDEMLILAAGADGELDEARVTAAIEWASSEADSYLSSRYATPIAVVPPVLVNAVGDIVRYRLTGTGTLENETILKRYENATGWLLRISKGLADLPGQDAGGEEDGTDGVGITPGTRDWL